MKKWYAYSIPPIDSRWHHLHRLEDVSTSLAGGDEEPPGDGSGFDGDAVSRFATKWEEAKVAAGAAGWEGDFRHEPRVFWLPVDESFEYGFVFKQDNNGDTYVVSPVPLGWLES